MLLHVSGTGAVEDMQALCQRKRLGQPQVSVSVAVSVTSMYESLLAFYTSTKQDLAGISEIRAVLAGPRVHLCKDPQPFLIISSMGSVLRP